MKILPTGERKARTLREPQGSLGYLSAMRIAVQSGAPWEVKVGYARAVRVGDRIVVTGTTGLTPDGAPTEGAAAQARQALTNIEVALTKLGASVRDVIRTRIFVTDIQRDWEAIGRVHGEVFANVRPATSMVEVSALIAPWMVVEIEAEAVVGSGALLHVEPAAINDHGAISALLHAVEQPVPGTEDAPVRMWVARHEGTVVGAAGLELHRPHGLLRSVVVAPSHRGRGLGAALTRSVIAAAREAGLTQLYLLTLHASAYFAGHGFAPITRKGFEGPVTDAHTYGLHACDDAVLMRRKL